MITKLDVTQKPQFGGQFILLVSFFSQSSFQCHRHLQSLAQRAIHGSKGDAMQTSQ